MRKLLSIGLLAAASLFMPGQPTTASAQVVVVKPYHHHYHYRYRSGYWRHGVYHRGYYYRW